MADLTEKRHDSVKRTVDILAGKGVISQPHRVDGGKAANGVTETVYEIIKRDSFVVVAQLSPEFTARLVDRWQELEAVVAAPAPAALSRMDLIQLALKAETENIALTAQLVAAAPAVAFVDNYVDSTGMKGFRQVCKLLGANEARFRDFLEDKKIMYRLGGEWMPHASHLTTGRFAVKAGTSDVSGHAFNSARFTPKGVAWVAGEWAKYQVEAKLEIAL